MNSASQGTTGKTERKALWLKSASEVISQHLIFQEGGGEHAPRPHSSCMQHLLATALMHSQKIIQHPWSSPTTSNQMMQTATLLVCTRLCTFISAPWNCVYIPITRGWLSCVDVVDVDMLSAAEESKCILYEPVPSLDHSSNLTWTIIKDQAETHTYLKKLTFQMAIAV